MKELGLRWRDGLKNYIPSFELLDSFTVGGCRSPNGKEAELKIEN